MIKQKFLTKIIPHGFRGIMRCPSCKSKKALICHNFKGSRLYRKSRQYICGVAFCNANYFYKKQKAYTSWELDFCKYSYWLDTEKYLFLSIDFKNKKSICQFEHDDNLLLEDSEKIKFPYKVVELQKIAHKMKNRLLFK